MTIQMFVFSPRGEIPWIFLRTQSEQRASSHLQVDCKILYWNYQNLSGRKNCQSGNGKSNQHNFESGPLDTLTMTVNVETVQFRRREALLDPTRNRSMTGNLSIAEVAMALWVAKHHQISSAWFHFGLNISTCDDYTVYIYISPIAPIDLFFFLKGGEIGLASFTVNQRLSSI